MRDKHNQVTTDPAEMAKILNEHWGAKFSRREIARHRIQSWLVGVPPLPPASDPKWLVDKEHIKQAIAIAKESAPGPDGIPYKAWKKLGDTAVEVLHDVAIFMKRSDSVQFLPKDFNQVFLCCLPKKVSGKCSVHGDFYDPQNTRPLSLVNTDNRLIANALRLVIEPLANQWVSKMQRGFLHGRSLLSNVVDVDYESMRVSLKHKRGMLVLFDFEAAFPSLSQELMMDCLCKIGLPQELLQAISCLYSNNEHILKLKGQRFPSFTATGGVRQGCPLSPLLFVICVDVLLRKLQHFFPSSCIRAYADDNAMVTPNFTRDGGKILALYKAFGEVSNLKLNLPKTFLIPLWPCSLEQMKATMLQERFPELCQTELNTWSLYLGFAIGPGRSTHSWQALVEVQGARQLVE